MTLEDTKKETTGVDKEIIDPVKEIEEIKESEDQDQNKEEEKMSEREIEKRGQNLGILLCKENLLSNSGTRIIIKADSILFLFCLTSFYSINKKSKK